MRRALSLLLILACIGCATASGQVTRSGIAGRVVAGPTCPVERVPPDPQCAPRPLAAALRIRRSGASGPGRVIHSGADGRFRIGLVPGVYQVQPLAQHGSPFPRPGPAQTVMVRRDRFSHIAITYDTGIR